MVKTKKSKAGAKPKPADQKKIAIATYHKAADIENIGGMDNARLLAYSAIEKKVKASRSRLGQS